MAQFFSKKGALATELRWYDHLKNYYLLLKYILFMLYHTCLFDI
jgi:hypothetical protein